MIISIFAWSLLMLIYSVSYVWALEKLLPSTSTCQFYFFVCLDGFLLLV